MTPELKKIEEEILSGSAQLFDVREKDEWEEGHLKLASFIPLSELQVGLAPEDKPLELKTYLHCRSGQRVFAAAPLLEGMGYQEVIPMEEGFLELLDNGFEAGQ